MWISKAYAAGTDVVSDLDKIAPAPSATEAFLLNMGLIGILVVLFYVLLIMPQQRRFKEHTKMLDSLKKGDRVVTAGGLIGKIDTIVNDREVVVDLGNSVKVTALRSMIQAKNDAYLKPANEDKKTVASKEPIKKAPKNKSEEKKADK